MFLCLWRHEHKTIWNHDRVYGQQLDTSDTHTHTHTYKYTHAHTHRHSHIQTHILWTHRKNPLIAKFILMTLKKYFSIILTGGCCVIICMHIHKNHFFQNNIFVIRVNELLLLLLLLSYPWSKFIFIFLITLFFGLISHCVPSIYTYTYKLLLKIRRYIIECKWKLQWRV